jgi:hypothetical protein
MKTPIKARQEVIKFCRKILKTGEIPVNKQFYQNLINFNKKIITHEMTLVNIFLKESDDD